MSREKKAEGELKVEDRKKNVCANEARRLKLKNRKEGEDDKRNERRNGNWRKE
jgi:hypothetical protein